MRSPCANPECSYQFTGVCARRAEFPDPETQCVDLRRGRELSGIAHSPALPPSAETEPTPALPSPSSHPSRFWSGLALGSHEAAELLLNSRSKLITIAGDKNSGKTCFLCALYIQMANGYMGDFPYRFAGSQSLRGFQELCNQAFQWRGGESKILPRSTQSNHRDPSFLHLALRESKSNPILPWHLLLTDMPGEWFENWVNHGSESLPHTLDFLPRSDGFVVTVDAARLLEERAYRKNQSYLIGRIVSLLKDSAFPQRPLALVLTKFDQLPKDAVPSLPAMDQSLDAQAWGKLQKPISTLLDALQDLPPQSPRAVFPCAAFSKPSHLPVGVFAPLGFVLKHATRHSPIQAPDPPRPNFAGPKRSRFFMMFQEGRAHG